MPLWRSISSAASVGGEEARPNRVARMARILWRREQVRRASAGPDRVERAAAGQIDHVCRPGAPDPGIAQLAAAAEQRDAQAREARPRPPPGSVEGQQPRALGALSRVEVAR